MVWPVKMDFLDAMSDILRRIRNYKRGYLRGEMGNGYLEFELHE